MEKQKRTKKVKTDKVPNPPAPSTKEGEQTATWTPGERFVVVRSGLRVSDKDYPKADDSRAIAERDFWQRVVTRHPDGTRVEIVVFDKKKHRIW